MDRVAQMEIRKRIKSFASEHLPKLVLHEAHEWDRQNLIAALQRIQGKEESAQQHVEKLLQDMMEAAPTRSPIVLSALASALGTSGQKRTWELLEEQALTLLPRMGPREMSHLAYAASRRPELQTLQQEIERAATLRLPEFPARSLCHLASACKKPKFLVAIASEIGQRDLTEFQPNEIAQATQAFARAREQALAEIEATVCGAADRFQPREWVTILWAFHDGKRQRAVEHLLERLPRDDFSDWKLLELVCLHDVAGQDPLAKTARDFLRQREPSTLSELAALLRIGAAPPGHVNMCVSLPFDDDTGLAQVGRYIPDRIACPQLQEAMDVLIARLADSIRKGRVERMQVVDLSSQDTRMLLEALDIPHAVYRPQDEGGRTTCHLTKQETPGGPFDQISTFTAGSGKTVDCSLKSCHLQFDRRRDAEFQALAFIMAENGTPSSTPRSAPASNPSDAVRYRLQVSRPPCMSCVWALWQARRNHDISIAFPD
eukprot:GEMP01024283.1.p1 GENE.GEMP01024283.1~~GEMP01024283.1.p1  ORF type:complete len:489 (+),score=127.07 GEMP01024283.1:203-1669(+)